MHRYCIVSGILLILPIIDFALAAPVLVQEKRQAGVDVMHIPEDAITMLGKRGDEFDELLHTLLAVTENRFATPGEPSSSATLGPADGWTNVKQPLPSIPEEPSQESSPDHASPGSSDTSSSSDEFNELWLSIFGHPESPLSPPKLDESSASWGLPPSGPAGGWTDVNQPLPSIPEEPSPVSSSPDNALPSPGPSTESGYELMKEDAPPGPSDPASSAMSSADHGLMGSDAPPNPGEMMDVPPSSPVSSTNPDRDDQSIDEDTPSGKRIKTERNWFFMLT
jgi:hypothetical protein